MAKEAKVTPDGLSVREEVFVAAYIVERDATKAAIAAGYSERSAYSTGQKVLHRPHVQKALTARTQQLSRKFRIRAEAVLEEYSIIGFSSIDRYEIDDTGHVALADGVPANAIRAVQSIRRKVRHIPQGKGKDAPPPIIEYDTEIKLWPKVPALHDLADHLKLIGKDAKPPEADDDDEQLTDEQRLERITALLKVAAKRARAAGGGRKSA